MHHYKFEHEERQYEVMRGADGACYVRLDTVVPVAPGDLCAEILRLAEESKQRLSMCQELERKIQQVRDMWAADTKVFMRAAGERQRLEEKLAAHEDLLEENAELRQEAEEAAGLERENQELRFARNFLHERLERKKAKVRKLKAERDELNRLWTSSAERLTVERRKTQAEREQAKAEYTAGRLDEREAVIACLKKMNQQNLTVLAILTVIREGKHLTAPAASPPQAASPEPGSAPR